MILETTSHSRHNSQHGLEPRELSRITLASFRSEAWKDWRCRRAGSLRQPQPARLMPVVRQPQMVAEEVEEARQEDGKIWEEQAGRPHLRLRLPARSVSSAPSANASTAASTHVMCAVSQY